MQQAARAVLQRRGDRSVVEALQAQLAERLEDGLERGARCFIADIEAPSPAMDTPAYVTFARLGFRRPYARTHWA